MASEHVVVVNESDFEEQVVRSAVPVLVDFWAEWCGPCKMLAPVLDDLATEYGGKLRVAKVDIESNPQLAAQFKINSIPTMILFKNGAIQSQIVGMKNKRDLKASLDKSIE